MSTIDPATVLGQHQGLARIAADHEEHIRRNARRIQEIAGYLINDLDAGRIRASQEDQPGHPPGR